MDKKDTVIFDLDGTLLNTLEDLRDSVNVVMEKYGYPVHSLEEIRTFVGNGIGKLMERSVPGGRDNPDLEQALSDFRCYYTGHCRIKTKPYDGVVELMKVLSDHGFKLAIVSNKNDAAVKELNEIYFGAYTKAALGDREGRARKPAPDAVFAALEQLGSSKEQAVYIGDSEVDIATGTNARMMTIGVEWGFRSRTILQEAGAAHIVSTPEEIMKLIRNREVKEHE